MLRPGLNRPFSGPSDAEIPVTASDTQVSDQTFTTHLTQRLELINNG